MMPRSSSESQGEKFVSIVDDDASVRNSARRLLRSSGFSAQAFASAEEFLNSESLAYTACLLLDVSMPGMGGLDLQNRLLAMGKNIPIIFLSARATEDEERRALQAGATTFLHKPASQDELLQAVRAVMASRA